MIIKHHDLKENNNCQQLYSEDEYKFRPPCCTSRLWTDDITMSVSSSNSMQIATYSLQVANWGGGGGGAVKERVEGIRRGGGGGNCEEGDALYSKQLLACAYFISALAGYTTHSFVKWPTHQPSYSAKRIDSSTILSSLLELVTPKWPIRRYKPQEQNTQLQEVTYDISAIVGYITCSPKNKIHSYKKWLMTSLP